MRKTAAPERGSIVKRTEIRQLFAAPESFDGAEVTVCGWVRTIRDSKAIGFIELNDGSAFKNLQIILETEKVSNFAEIVKLNVGSAICVRGRVILTPQAKQPLEVHADEVVLEGASTPDYPLQKKRHTLEFLRSIAHLRPRTNTFEAVFRVRSVAAYAIHRFFNERGFVYAHTPLITGSDCEGAGEMFRVTTLDPKNPPLTEDGAVDFAQDFFGKATGLTVSGQLEGEALANAYASLSNAYLDGVLSVFFLVMMAAFLAVGVKTVVSTVRARAYGDHLTSQEPFLESNWFAPSGLIATRLERKVQHEFEHHPARPAELG